MNRPSMDPMFIREAELLLPRSRKLRGQSIFLSPFQLLGRVLLADICFWRAGAQLNIEDEAPAVRILRASLYRLLFVPVVLATLVAALVWIGTHAPVQGNVADPVSHGIHYDPVNFVTADNVQLEGWLVPALDAKTVLEHKEQAIRARHPAVILVHDFGANRLQMLPLIRPLHEAGYVVLVMRLRSAGGITGSGCAFGLREYADVLAGVELLRRQPGVDPQHIAVLGIGTGANAAILAAQRDQNLTALILDHPVLDADRFLAEHIGPPQPWLRWLTPLCKWTFELCYRVDADELDIGRYSESLKSKPVLMFDSSAVPAQSFRPRGMHDIRMFLARHMPPPALTPTLNANVRELE